MLSLTLLCLTTNAAYAAQRQLEELFGDFIDIKSIVIGDLKPNTRIDDALVVVTSHNINLERLDFIDSNAKVIVADRVIDISSVSKLYQIPAGTSVLVVNQLFETAIEAINQLIGAGVTHLKFFPFYPGIESWNTECEYAITFGEKQLIPTEISNKIDLGIRPIDITTCINISMELNIYGEIKSTLTSIFLRPSLQLLFHYAEEYDKNIFLTDKLQQLLNIFKSGIVLLDNDNKISFYNKKAKQQLKIKNNTSIFINEILSKYNTSGQDFIFVADDRYFHIEINSNDRNLDTIITIEDIKNIERIEKSYRVSLYERGLVAEYRFEDIIYSSSVMRELVLKAQQFAKSNSTVLIEGDSGTGKELFAQAIHNASDRKNEAFVALNFAALSESLCESELFGYVEGAFTGAKKGGKRGLFEMAHKGTIFLDEIGDASLNIQKKILRVIQERQVLPVGGSQLIPIDIRIITATNRDLQAMVNKRTFREDLYYRLNILPLRIPPLRGRADDIFLLFTEIMNNQFNIVLDPFPKEIKKMLEAYKWPGNIRELQNVAEYISNYVQLNMDWEAELHKVLRKKIDNTAAEKNEITDSVIDNLEKQDEIRIFIDVLETLDTPPFKWTRKTLKLALNNKNIIISESQLKRYLLILKENGLIQSKTGDGTYIKDAGRLLIENYKEKI